MQGIDGAIAAEVKRQLAVLAEQYQVSIISAIESGSRSWGFPSPDSDYDVRFVYMHQPAWYIQLNPERDVIEIPVSDELDIVGWDVRKAMQLANKGNSVIQEWMISPLVYQQDDALSAQLKGLIKQTFNARAVYHHYCSMAKNMSVALNDPTVKLKRFFYISRATLSALWVVRMQNMPTTVFPDLLSGLTSDAAVRSGFTEMIRDKAIKGEREIGWVDPVCQAFIQEALQEVLEADADGLPPRRHALNNEDLRALLQA